MEPLFLELEKILQQQGEILSQSVQTAQQQNAALRKNDQAGLGVSVQQQTGLTAQMNLLDNQRQNQLQQLAGQLGLRLSITLPELLAYAPAPVKKNLQQLAGQISQTAGQLAEINKYNRDLTRQALRFTDFMMRALQPGGQTYNHSGKVQQVGQRNLINKSI